MAEEFAKFLVELNKESTEIQLEKLKDIVFNLFNLVGKLINGYAIDLNLINDKINSLENQINFKAQPPPLTPNLPLNYLKPPPSPSVSDKNAGKENTRGLIMNELKELFNKKKVDK